MNVIVNLMVLEVLLVVRRSLNEASLIPLWMNIWQYIDAQIIYTFCAWRSYKCWHANMHLLCEFKKIPCVIHLSMQQPWWISNENNQLLRQGVLPEYACDRTLYQVIRKYVNVNGNLLLCLGFGWKGKRRIKASC